MPPSYPRARKAIQEGVDSFHALGIAGFLRRPPSYRGTDDPPLSGDRRRESEKLDFMVTTGISEGSNQLLTVPYG